MQYASNVNTEDFLRYGQVYIFSFVTAILFCIPWLKKKVQGMLCKTTGTIFCTALFLLSIYFLAQGLDNPFLYYRF